MRNWVTSESGSPQASPGIDEVGLTAKIVGLQEAIGEVIKGKPEAVKQVLIALFARGHILIEDVPGIGKTTLANALAKAVGLSFQRIQFTSDLLPSDVTGLSVYNQQTGDFEWKSGPVFANIVLADEINRATPKTQSALLEAMAEEQVTTDGVSRPLPAPFMVVATQNPTDHHGTYPLPESQLDRFMMRIGIGYPGKGDELAMLRDREAENPLERIGPVITPSDVASLQEAASAVSVDESLLGYLLEIVEQTRTAEDIDLGVSPRGSLALFRCAQALALVEGRNYCIADDIKRLVMPVFAHRIKTVSRSGGLRGGASDAEHVLGEILERVAVPV